MHDTLLVERHRTLQSEVAEAIASHRDLTALFRDLARRLPAIVPFEFISLFLYDPERNVMRIHMLGTAEADSIPPGMEIPIEEGFSGTVFTSQQPVIISHPREAERFPRTLSLMHETGVQSFCMLPLTTIVRRLGAIGFGSSRFGAFGRSDVEFLQQVAAQVAVAVDNVLHEESATTAQLQLRDERDRLRLLLEVSESIASYRDLSKLFQDLVQRLPRIVPFDYINLILHDSERDVMRLHILAAPSESTVKAGTELPVDDSPGGYVWKTQKPLMVEDVSLDDRFSAVKPMLRENGVQSYCVVPLTTALRRLGAMGFGSLQKRAYQESEVTFMQEVAKQIAVAVDNVLHDASARSAQQQLARERDRLQLLLEVNNAVVSHLDMDAVFASVSASLQRVIQHNGCSLLLYEPESGRYRCHVLRVDKNESFVEEGQADRSVKSPGCIAISTKAAAVFGEQDLKDLAAESKIAQHLLAEGVKSFCSIPLQSHDRILGTLNIGRLSKDAFTPEEVELLGQVAQQIAIAVENGLAYRQIAELKEKLNEEKLYLEDEIRTEHNFEEIVGDSEPLKHVLKQVEIVAPTDSTVLIQGETGTGKELVARAIHNLSSRRGRTFVKLNCAAIPTGLLESELFGHEKGAFTGAIAQKIGRFELAHGGTLFLDELGDIPLELQSKFLRVLQEQEFERLGGNKTIRVDIRLVAATNRDLATMVTEKQFRSDLYYRLNVFPIMSPPLRDRAEDIPALVYYFTRKFARRMNKQIDTIPTETMAALSRYHWPGNIRELENFIERAVILSRGSSLAVPLAELKQRTKVTATDNQRQLSTLEEAEREHIRRALQQANWLVGGPSGAAAKLGMKRTTLQSKMAKLGIERPAVGT
jgi:formate hydrogenlyase transcriptional activator